MLKKVVACAAPLLVSFLIPSGAVQALPIPYGSPASSCGSNKSMCIYTRAAYIRMNYQISEIFYCPPGSTYCPLGGPGRGYYYFYYWFRR